MYRHALYVTCKTSSNETITFRIGQPTDWRTAQNRWERIANRAQGFGLPARKVTVRFDGRRFRVDPRMVEVRSVDKFGRGLGSDRHTLAFPVPFRNLRSAR